MTSSQTPAGTPILNLSAQEYSAFLDREAHARMGMSAAQFTQRYLDGTIDDSDPDVPLLVGLIGLGQNGHNAAA
jgi:hypothetical protein